VNIFRKQNWMPVGVGMVLGLVVGFRPRPCDAGDMTVDGNVIVMTNLVVRGQLNGGTMALTNLAVSSQATIRSAVILELVPQGDLSMGPYTNRVAGQN